MNKSVIKISLAFVVIAALVLILLGLRSIDGGGTEPSYRFLAGQNPVSSKKAKKRTEDSRGIEDRRYIYSFEADFNDICSRADAELILDGFSGNTFVDKTFSDNGSPCRMYYLKERFPRGNVCVYIYNNRQYIDIHDLNKNIPKSKNYGLAEKAGWVTVEVFYWRGWRWPF